MEKSQEIIQIRDFKLPQGAKVLCINDPPVCQLAEGHFVESIIDQSAERIAAMVNLFCMVQGKIYWTILSVREVIVKHMHGVVSGIILDSGPLHSFIVARDKTTDERFSIARPLNRTSAFGGQLSSQLHLEALSRTPIYTVKLTEKAYGRSVWHDSCQKLGRGELPSLGDLQK